MKFRTKLAVVGMPIAMIFFVCRNPNERVWVKVLTVLWTLLFSAMAIDVVWTEKSLFPVLQLSILFGLVFLVFSVIVVLLRLLFEYLSLPDQSKVKNIQVDSTYRMTYKDSNGDVSNRTIEVISLEKKKELNVTYLKAVCLDSNGIRTFRSDRIISLVDTETGEVCI
ncbi:WYL domain-containing protein [Vibrio vulnificus]|uniref:WYL domain-containing protein n=1 Tax=Vibrio vulnificus TaxID=672 RepID=UPI00102923CF|nr:WYL domain-containing protein [Vibrio vulnificus]RZP89595.1 hypothetical protein D8T54_19645 [Vibrio vulnificus]RZR41897.1 hypothetical protein D8T58_20130 [Vibrio vulnificus]